MVNQVSLSFGKERVSFKSEAAGVPPEEPYPSRSPKQPGYSNEGVAMSKGMPDTVLLTAEPPHRRHTLLEKEKRARA